ncbi:MAG: Gfo/Idh/MocA family oxidoreductase, partial [Planctomycetota bacterium]
MSDPRTPERPFDPNWLLEPGWAPSRRSILRGAAALGAPIVLGAGAGAQESAPEELEEEAASDLPPLKVGIVGCGGRGTGAAWQAMHAENGSVVLHAMGDLFEDRLEGSASTLEQMLAEEGNEARMDVPSERRFTGFDAYQKVMDAGIDVVLLTTPPGFRPAHLEHAVRKGLHIFCEKPVAVDVPGALRAARASL